MPISHLPDPEEHQRIGEYRLIETLGKGGQGTVYLGETPSGTRVAIKVLHAWAANDSNKLKRFLREAEVARKVASFCTAKLLDMGVVGERPYIVSEYISGHTLQNLVRADGPQSDGRLQQLAIGTLTALASIHQAGIVHCDFKPGNVIMSAVGPVVVDFGVSLLMTRATTQSEIVGTPAYMAPEQFEGRAITSAADMFSWAGTMVFAATGHPPFPGDTHAALMYAIRSHDPDLTGLGLPLRPLVSACMDRSPEARPTAEEVLRGLTGLLQSPGPAPQKAPLPKTALQKTTPHETAAGKEQAPGEPPPEPAEGLLSAGEVPGERPTATITSPSRTENDTSSPVGPPPNPADAGNTTLLVTAPLPSTSSKETPPPPLLTRRRLLTVLATVTGAGAAGAAILAATRTTEPPLAPSFGTNRFLVGHRERIFAVAVGELDGKPIAVTGSYDGTALVWNLEKGTRIGSLPGHKGTVYGAAIGHPGGRAVAVTGCNGNAAPVWDLKDMSAPRHTLPHNDGVRAVAMEWFNGTAIAVTGSKDGLALVWNVATGTLSTDPLTGHSGPVTAVATGRLDGRTIAVAGGEDHTVLMWDLEKSVKPQLTLKHDAGVSAVALHELKGRTIAVTGSGDTALVWDLKDGSAPQLTLEHEAHVNAVAVGELNGTPVALVGCADSRVWLWNPVTGERFDHPLNCEAGGVQAVAMGRLHQTAIAVIGGGNDHQVQISPLG